MCGIAGWATCAPLPAPDAVLASMLQTIAHRGPDGDGRFVVTAADGRHQVGLGHRRLAIIDLDSGQQPMYGDDRSTVLVFNGEIYNYTELRQELGSLGHAFATRSDTEVLLRAYEQWGEDCVLHLRGMFAFAVWDARRQALFLARDAFGKKPLFLCETATGLAFASEIKALLAMPGVPHALDRDSIVDYLIYRYVPAPNTLFQGIRKLRPGSHLTWHRGVSTETTWFLPYDGFVQPGELAASDCVAAFQEKLDESVRIRMQSDVPFGAFLSGGLDSSTIVALMSRHSARPVNTFSVGFEGHDQSELPYARQVARHFATEHDEIVLSAEQYVDLIPRVVRALDAPISEPATVPLHALSLLAARRVKMVLSGEGADEFLGGYTKYFFEPLVPIYQRLLPEVLWKLVLKRAIETMPFRLRKVRTLAANFALDDVRQRFPRWFGALSPEELGYLLRAGTPHRSLDTRPFDTRPGLSALRRIQYFDQISWLPDNLLERGDRVTMAASLEARMPFMDHELSALIAAFPDSARIRGFTGKWVLREAMKTILPPAILERPKVGFALPLSQWLRGPMKHMVCDLLLDPAARIRDYVRPEIVTAYVEDHIAGRQDHEKLIWSLLNLELFQREYSL